MRFLALLTCALWAGAALADVINVPGDYAQIHDAVQAAQSGDEVVVAPGTYNDCTHETEGPGSTLACVIMKDGVTLRGSGQTQTIIDAQGLGRCIYVADLARCRIENLQVTGAFAEAYGSGILVSRIGEWVDLVDLLVTGNHDGGIICKSGGHAEIVGCSFVGNVNKLGGGIAIQDTTNATVRACLIEGNEAPAAGGVYIRSHCSVIIEDSEIVGNEVTAGNGTGGGISVHESDLTLRGTEIRDNITLGFGGGILFSSATANVHDCLITGNRAAGDFNEGAGIHSSFSEIYVHDVVIAGNLCTGAFADGGGVYVGFSPSPVFEYCTIVGNSGDTAGGIYAAFNTSPEFRNCIIANSPFGAGVACNFGATPIFTGCDIWGNAGGDAICGTDGGCNFSADPLFCTEPGLQYHIQAGSPCAADNHPTPGCGTYHCGAYPAGCSVGVEDLPRTNGLALAIAPNPFNPRTSIHFVLDQAGDAMVRIFDLRGHEVRDFRFQGVRAGERIEFTWDGENSDGRAQASGVYFCQLESGGVTTSKRMSLIR